MRRFLVILTLLLLISSPVIVLADAGGADQGIPVVTETPPASRTVTLKDPLNITKGIPQLAGNIIKAAVGVVGAFALLIFVYGGFLWLTSAGEPAKIQSGKDAMKWAAIGLIVVYSSYALVSFVLTSLGQKVS